MRYSIMVGKRCVTDEYEFCQVDTNPEDIVEALRQKCQNPDTAFRIRDNKQDKTAR
jgi:hypothetical protein